MIREPEDIQNRVRNTLGPIQTLHDIVEQLIMCYGNDEKFVKDWNWLIKSNKFIVFSIYTLILGIVVIIAGIVK